VSRCTIELHDGRRRCRGFPGWQCCSGPKVLKGKTHSYKRQLYSIATRPVRKWLLKPTPILFRYSKRVLSCIRTFLGLGVA
jgi:hypothetical protein